MRMVGQIEMCRLDGISADVLTRSSIYVLCECWFVIIAKRLLRLIRCLQSVSRSLQVDKDVLNSWQIFVLLMSKVPEDDQG